MTGSTRVLPESVATTIRDDVLTGRIRPGASVTEADVALRFGIARPTARGAIDRLVAQGLLRRAAHASARVPVLDRGDIVELYDARAIVERAAIAALAASGAVPAAAIAANRALAAAVRSDGFAAEDIAFHRALVDAQPNGRLDRMHETLMGEIALCIGQVHAHHLLSPTTIAREHQGVLDAVVAGRPGDAEHLLGAHITHSRDRILSHYDATHPDEGAH